MLFTVVWVTNSLTSELRQITFSNLKLQFIVGSGTICLTWFLTVVFKGRLWTAFLVSRIWKKQWKNYSWRVSNPWSSHRYFNYSVEVQNHSATKTLQLNDSNLNNLNKIKYALASYQPKHFVLLFSLSLES